MRAEFNTLVETLKRWDLYQIGDEVDMDLKALEDKITEVEKRMECVKRTNVDSHEILFTNQVKLEESIGYDNVEILQRSVTDIDIALDLSINEPIECNWYGLFEVEQEVSSGGIPYEHCAECNIKEEEIVMTKMSNGVHLCCDCKEEPPTYQSSEPETFDKVKQVIEILKTLHNGDCVDGETMQYILERIGMSDQMLRQLIMSNPHTDTTDILEEKRILSNRGELNIKSRGCIEI